MDHTHIGRTTYKYPLKPVVWLYCYTHIGNGHKSNNTHIGINSVITDQANVMK